MALLSVLAIVGCASNNSSSSGNNGTATPSFSPGAGTYNASQTVTIADTTKGAVLYCTTDGTTPTASSSPCSQPTTVSTSEFLQAIAVAPGQAPSAVASAGYTIDLKAVATPTFSPAGATYSTGQKVTINDATSGANIYYTSDGSVPTVNSTLYTGPITLTKSVTLSAIAVASGYNNSGVASAAYTVSTTPATPVISPAGGTFTEVQPVTITDATTGASIYYTLDGSTPTANSTAYTGAFNVSTSQTVSAIAISPGGSSTVATAAFTISIPVATAPTFNPAAGTFTSAQQVTLSDATTGATIYYTLDGSMPNTTLSMQYSGTPINVGTSETIKAIAAAPGFTTSAVASAAYTINLPVAAPTFNPGAGNYSSAQSVTISDATTGATIYYTTDGSTPTTSLTPYNGSPIAVSANETLSAIAAIGIDTSAVTVAAYTINLGPSYTGKVMSGTLPVVGATVQMYAAGNTGYASAATLETSPATGVTTGSDGSFTLNYNCPAAGGDLVYLVATGGHTGSNTASNAGLAFMAALGPCTGTLPSSVVMNEVTTVASAYALSPFMTGVANVGSSASNYEKGANSAPGLANAFATGKNLVDLTTGTTLTNTPDYPTNLAGDTNLVNNSTVPTARINTLANALNACAAAGTGCSSLFSAATPSSGTAPTDTLQAILNIAQNPGNNAGMVFNVAPTGPFTPVLPGAPNDWTLALTFTGGGVGFTPDLQIPYSTLFTDGKFLNTAMAIDATGNVWVTGFTDSRSTTNASSTVVSDLTSGMIAEFNNLGKPLTPPSKVASGGAVTYGGYIPVTGGNNGGTVAGHSIALDPSGNAWVVGGAVNAGGGGGAGGSGGTTSPGGAITEVSPGPLGSSGLATFSVAIPYISIAGPQDAPIAIDGSGDVWTYGAPLVEFDSTGKQIASNTGAGTSGNSIGYLVLESLIFDAKGTSLWGSDARLGEFFQISPKDGSGIFDYSWVAGRNGVFTNIVADSVGNVYGCRVKPGQEFDVFNATNTTSTSVASYPISTERGCGSQMVMDGAGHIFTVTGSTSSTITPGIIDEFNVTSSAITLVSPTSGYTGTSSGETPTINGDPSIPAIVTNTYPQNNRGGIAGAAIDGSGNLWVLNVDTGTDAAKGNALVEYVGIAAPIVTPTSLALQFGEVGVKP